METTGAKQHDLSSICTQIASKDQTESIMQCVAQLLLMNGIPVSSDA